MLTWNCAVNSREAITVIIVVQHSGWENNPLLMSNMGLKMAIFNKNAIKYTKWPLLTAYNS